MTPATATAAPAATPAPTRVPAAAPAPAPEPLARAGYARMRDLETPRVRELLRRMEEFQALFMAATYDTWPRSFRHTPDRLDNWSRRWEYPYVWWNLAARKPGRVLDAGSGINFFPFLLDQTGWQVTCLDTNPVLAERYRAANAASSSHVTFREGAIESLPFEDGAFDAVYSISVLEHAPERFRAIDEFARVLAPGGRLVLTWDVSLARDSDIRLEDVAVLLAALGKRFAPVHPVDLLRDADLLTTDRMRPAEAWRLSWRRHPQALRRWLSHLRHGDPFRSLTVMGSSWIRRD